MSLDKISAAWDATQDDTRWTVYDAINDATDIATDITIRIAIGTQHIITDSIWDIFKEAIDGLG